MISAPSMSPSTTADSLRPLRAAGFVVPLDDPRGTLATVGGKALNLGVMRRAKLPVPDGFVVTTDAYHAFVEANGLGSAILAAWESVGATEALEAASEELRAAFAAGRIPPAIEQVARSAYARMGADVRVAVRSSATAEDLPTASQRVTVNGTSGRVTVHD